jgi:hypothetical protein
MRYLIVCIFFFQAWCVHGAEKDNTKAWLDNARLFTTPLERTRLDGLRQTASILALQAQEAKKEPEEEVETPLPAEVHMQGYVKRSDGKKNTVWVNRKPIQENVGNGDVQVGTLSTKFKSKGKLDGADEVRLKLPSNGQNFNLKAGQRYLPDENRVVDLSTKSTEEKIPNDQMILLRKNTSGSKSAR